jgi:hypothetical protein
MPVPAGRFRRGGSISGVTLKEEDGTRIYQLRI